MDDLLRFIQRQLDEKIVVKQEAVGDGQAEDWAAYKHITGEIAGLKEAKTTIREAVRRYMQSDEEEDDV